MNLGSVPCPVHPERWGVPVTAARPGDEPWRVGRHYGIHVYAGDKPIATFHDPADAQRAVNAVNAAERQDAQADDRAGT